MQLSHNSLKLFQQITQFLKLISLKKSTTYKVHINRFYTILALLSIQNPR